MRHRVWPCFRNLVRPRGRAFRTGACIAALAIGTSPLSADLRREVEPNDFANVAQPIVAPASLGGAIGLPGDVDLYAVAARPGQIIRADVLARGFRAASGPGSELSAVLEIRDTDGVTVLAQDQSLGDFDDPTAMAEVPTTGTYFIAVRDLSPLEGGPGYIYVLSVEIDSNDTFEDATPLVPPVLPSIDALIYPAGDLDYYRLEGRAGQILTVDIDSAVFNPVNPPAKIILTVYDENRSILARDAFTSTDEEDPFIQLSLGADATYFIEVRELRIFVGTTNTFYQMSIELGPSNDNGTFATGMPIAIPRAVSGVISTNADVDHFRFVLPSSSTVHADLDARQDLLSLLVGTLRLNDSGGILASDNSVPDPVLAGALAAGEYSISVGGPCSGGGCRNEDSYYVLFIDPDADGDGLVLPRDNCPVSDNPDQADSDGDGAGNVCDNCPSVFNPDQRDSDGDGVGDACGICAPPTEVATDLVFLDGETLGWSVSAPVLSYAVYRGSRGIGPWVYNHTCLEPSLPAPGFVDVERPETGVVFYYLVSGWNTCGEGSLGPTSAGETRPNTFPCP